MTAIELLDFWRKGSERAVDLARRTFDKVRTVQADLELLVNPIEARRRLGPDRYAELGKSSGQLGRALHSLAEIDQALWDLRADPQSVRERERVLLEWIEDIGIDDLVAAQRIDPATEVLHPGPGARVPLEALLELLRQRDALVGRLKVDTLMDGLAQHHAANLYHSAWRLRMGDKLPVPPVDGTAVSSALDHWVEESSEMLRQRGLEQLQLMRSIPRGFNIEQLLLPENAWVIGGVSGDAIPQNLRARARTIRKAWAAFGLLVEAGAAHHNVLEPRRWEAAAMRAPQATLEMLHDGWQVGPGLLARFGIGVGLPPLKVLKQAAAYLQDTDGSLGEVTAALRFQPDLVWTILELLGRLPLRPLVGVLLPLRLETRWMQKGTDWTLKLRVIPDDIARSRHDSTPRIEELEALDAVYQACDGNLANPGNEGKASWTALVGAMQGGRAAWLARNHPPIQIEIDGKLVWEAKRPAVFKDARGDNTIHGLPSSIHVDLLLPGGLKRLGSLAPDVAKVRTVSFPEDINHQHWFTSFDAAKQVGMGIELYVSGADAAQAEALIVSGLSSENPKELFESLQDSGDLAIVAPGVATNTVDGGETAHDLVTPEVLRDLAVAESADAAVKCVAEALTGDQSALLHTPAPDHDPEPLGRALVEALWPSLWGHTLAHVWNLRGHSYELAIWAADNLRPLGPFASLRAYDQPYGLLPVTNLGTWIPQNGDPGIEAGLVPWIHRYCAAFAKRAENRGTTIGADTSRLVELMGMLPASPGYEWWSTLSTLNLARTLRPEVTPMQLEQNRKMLDKWWVHAADRGFLGEGLGNQFARKYIDTGSPHPMRLPLVVPANLPISPTTGRPVTFKEALEKLMVFNSHIGEGWLREYDPIGNTWPDSLLFRLLVFAKNRSAADLVLASGTGLEADSRTTKKGRLCSDAMAMSGTASSTGSLEEQVYVRVRKSGRYLATVNPELIERGLRHTLDAASHRLDSWVTGIARRRLSDHIADKVQHRLGVYGWVDTPRPGTPGPTEGGLILAPSTAQAQVSVVLRDHALHEPKRWGMKLDSHLVRTADRIAEAVRVGIPLQEAVGIEVEDIVGDLATVLDLRKDWGARSHHDGRHPCNGLLVLEDRANVATKFGLSLSQKAALDDLESALEAYADLLLAEAVNHLVTGRPEAASGALEAAAGLGRPPSLEVLETPTAGAGLTNTVLVALPAADTPTTIISPTQISDNAVASWLASIVPSVSSWTWTVTDSANTPKVISHTVALSDLGLEIADAALLDPARLEGAVLVHVVAEKGVGTWEIDTTSPARAAHKRVRFAVGAISPSAALPDSIINGVGRAEAFDELAKRLDKLIKRAEDDLKVLRASNSLSIDVRRILLQWHLHATDSPATDGLDKSDLAQLEADRLSGAVSALSGRIADANETRKGSPSIEDLAGICSILLCGDGRWPVLVRALWPAQIDGRTMEQDQTLDDEWLARMGALRTNLGSLDVFQLETAINGSSAALMPWSSHRGDSWRESAFSAPNPTTGRFDDAHLHVVYAGGDLALGTTQGPLALGLLDRWVESVPAANRSMGAAFGFNGPRSQPPQAVLLAVAGDASKTLQSQLPQIIQETRTLAHCRAADPTVLGDFGAVLPTTTLPAGGEATIHYDPVSL
jgi:hypothetical protein